MRQQVLKDAHGTKPSLNKAQGVSSLALRWLIREFQSKFPDASRPEAALEPHDSMSLLHLYFAITALWRKQHAEGLLHFLATEKKPKLHMTIAGQKHFFEMIHLYDAPTAWSHPLLEHSYRHGGPTRRPR